MEDLKKLIERLTLANETLEKTMSATAKTKEQIAARDAAIAKLNAELQETARLVKEADEFCAKATVTDDITKKRGQLKTLGESISTSLTNLQEFTGKSKVAQQKFNAGDKAGVEAEKLFTEAGKTVNKGVHLVVDTIKDLLGMSAKTPEELKAEEEAAKKNGAKPGFLDSITGMFKNLNGKGLLGTILGGLGGFFLGRMFGSGTLGTIAGLLLACGGALMGRNFAMGKSDGVAGNKPNDGPEKNKVLAKDGTPVAQAAAAGQSPEVRDVFAEAVRSGYLQSAQNQGAFAGIGVVGPISKEFADSVRLGYNQGQPVNYKPVSQNPAEAVAPVNTGKQPDASKFVSPRQGP
jgi:hypothetical protein